MEKTQEIILQTNSESQAKICVHSDITKYLKIHQIDGIKFMFENCFVQNSGCILAHCMGLGKTLQVISMLHAVINSSEYPTNKILVLCPISTISMWKEEIVRWLAPINDAHRKLQIFELEQKDDIQRKISFLQKWSQCDSKSPAACLIMGYDAFRNLVNFHSSKGNVKKYTESGLRQIRESITNYLLKPADIVICDEGHKIKNINAGVTIAVNQIRTKRRIILTGTPMQNHLMEYYSMVNFVKPKFLDTKQHFNEYFAEPITAGQHADSCESDIKYMKQRSYALNKKLSKIVQRREISLLKDFLPEKFEFVLFVPLTEIQYKLYKYFLDYRGGTIEYKRLFGDYTCLRKIWTHLKVLDNAHQKSIAKKKRATNSNDDENSGSDNEEDQFGELQLVDNDWWRKVIDKSQLESALSSHKMILLFEILKECQRVGDKCVIFSSFVEVLNVVEYFLQQIDQKNGSGKAGLDMFVGPWKKNEDYYRLDGSTPRDRRHPMITKFNDVDNKRTKVFLISAEAGGQGVNLFGANRLILLDTAWNPAKDQQSIFRIYRMGQTKQCYIYRLLSMGTMEEKIYSRSVTKQAMSCRVVDKQQIDRHYSMNELYELYSLTKTDTTQRPVPKLPKDNLLANLLQNRPNMIYKYLEHDTLLANKVEEELNDAEKNEAWQRCQEQNLKMHPHDVSDEKTDDSSKNKEISALFGEQVTAIDDTLLANKVEEVLNDVEKNETTPMTSFWQAPNMSVEQQTVTPSSFPSQIDAIQEVPVEPQNQMVANTLEWTEPSGSLVDIDKKTDDSLDNNLSVSDKLKLVNDTLLENKAEEKWNDAEKNEALQWCQEPNLQMQALNNMSVEQQTVPSQSPTTQAPTESQNRVDVTDVTMVELKEPLVVDMEEKTDDSSDKWENLSFDKQLEDSTSSSPMIRVSVNESQNHMNVTELKLKESLTVDMDEKNDLFPDNKENSTLGKQLADSSSSFASQHPKILVPAESQNGTDLIKMELMEPSTIDMGFLEVKTDDSLDKNENLSIDKQLADSSHIVESQSPTIRVPSVKSKNHIELNDFELKESLVFDTDEKNLSYGEKLLAHAGSENTSNFLHVPFGSNEVIQECSEDKKNFFADDDQCLAESSTTSAETPNDDPQGLLLPLKFVDNENQDDFEEKVTRSLASFAKAIFRRVSLLHTLNASYAVRSLQQQQSVPIEDYSSEEEIISSNQFHNLEYRISFKRPCPSDSIIQRPIKKLKLSLEIDSTAAITVDQTLSTLLLMIDDTKVQDPQSPNENSSSNDMHLEPNVVDLNGAELSKHVTVLLSTHLSEDKIDLNDVVKPISTATTEKAYGCTSVPLNDVITENTAEDDKMCPKCVAQQSKELVTGLTYNDEHSSNSMDSDASMVYNSDVEDEEMSSDSVDQSKECTVIMNGHAQQSFAASIHSEVSNSSTEGATTSSGHLGDDDYVDYERNIPAHSIGRTYNIHTQNEENSIADISATEDYSANEQDAYVEKRYPETGSVQSDDSMEDFNTSKGQPSTLSKIKDACALM